MQVGNVVETGISHRGDSGTLIIESCAESTIALPARATRPTTKSGDLVDEDCTYTLSNIVHST
jgi:hypothetical protein